MAPTICVSEPQCLVVSEYIPIFAKTPLGRFSGGGLVVEIKPAPRVAIILAIVVMVSIVSIAVANECLGLSL